MNTRRYFNAVLSAVFVMGLGMSVTSCKSDDDSGGGDDNQVSTLTLDESVMRNGVETDMESAVVPLNVKCNGAWSVAIEKGKDWVSVENNKIFYNGSQTLQLLFDENRTEVDRTATLYITNDANEKVRPPTTRTSRISGARVWAAASMWDSCSATRHRPLRASLTRWPYTS